MLQFATICYTVLQSVFELGGFVLACRVLELPLIDSTQPIARQVGSNFDGIVSFANADASATRKSQARRFVTIRIGLVAALVASSTTFGAGYACVRP